MLLAMVSLDLLVVVLAALLAVISSQEALLFAVAYIVASWIFGGYAVLSWPWVARSRLVQRSVLVVAATVALVWLAGGQGSILLLAVVQLSWAIDSPVITCPSTGHFLNNSRRSFLKRRSWSS